MKRVYADASLHDHGRPLRPLETPREQSLFEDFGLTYRERLTEVERQRYRRRLGDTDVPA